VEEMKKRRREGRERGKVPAKGKEKGNTRTKKAYFLPSRRRKRKSQEGGSKRAGESSAVDRGGQSIKGD